MVSSLPRSQDAVQAAIADGMCGRALAYTWDERAEPFLASSQSTLEAAGERDFLPNIVTVRGMIAAPRDRTRAIALLGRAVELATELGYTTTEDWARSMIVYAHFMAGALDEAQQVADEAVELARRQQNDEGTAYALIGKAYVSLGRGDLSMSRTHFAEAVSLARSRESAWPRCMALCGLASVTAAIGDEAGARAVVEEALHYSIGAGFIAVDPMCGAIALILAQQGDRERATRVFAPVRPGAEDETSTKALLADPTGALRRATREARRILGNPPPVEPDSIDYAAVLQAAIDSPRQVA